MKTDGRLGKTDAVSSSVHTFDPKNKLIAVTGAAGTLGGLLCRMLLGHGAELILLDRNPEKSKRRETELKSEFPSAKIHRISVDLADISSVTSATERLKKLPLSGFIHCAGAYHIKRELSQLGVDNVFQINFVSPYCIIRELIPVLEKPKKESGGETLVGIVSSIAAGFSSADRNDIDFKKRRSHEKVYGNAKRYLTFSVFELLKDRDSPLTAAAHPGVTPSGITSHYPRFASSLIKYPMRLIFPSPEKAARSLTEGFLEPSGCFKWVGPKYFGIWGPPERSDTCKCSEAEREFIFHTAEALFEKMKSAAIKGEAEQAIQNQNTEKKGEWL